MASKQTIIPRSYEIKAQKLIREALWQRGTTYRQLAEHLSARGIPFTRDNLVNKISRGRFSAGFLLLCLEVLRDQHGREAGAGPSQQAGREAPVIGNTPRL